MNPISNDQNYQNRVKELLPQVTYIDDRHRDLVFSLEVDTNESLRELVKDDFKAVSDKNFVLAKFARFS
jgi:hypothetical protein